MGLYHDGHGDNCLEYSHVPQHGLIHSATCTRGKFVVIVFQSTEDFSKTIYKLTAIDERINSLDFFLEYTYQTRNLNPGK